MKQIGCNSIKMRRNRSRLWPGWLLLTLMCFSSLGRSSGAQPGGAFVPIIGEGLLIGGARNGKWLDDTKAHALVKGGEKYRFYTFDGLVGTAVGASIERAGEGAQRYYLSFTSDPPRKVSNDSDEPLIAVAGTWNPQPRKMRMEDPQQQVYLAAVGEVLKTKGLPNAKPHIRKIVRVDLEGRGVDSVLIDAASPDEYGSGQLTAAGKNSYCFVLLRTVVGGKVKSFVLEGDFWKKPPGMQGEEDSRLFAVLDLNGDGVMEIVTYGRGHEGFGFTIYQVIGGKPKQVLVGGDGA